MKAHSKEFVQAFEFMGIKTLRAKLPLCSLAALALIILTYRFTEVPPLFFDEGWNLSVARNWVEYGHYGLLINARQAPPLGVSVGFPAIMPLAVSFRLLGVGVGQARLPGIIFTAGALILIYYITSKLYGKQIATGALCVLLFMPMHPELNSFFVGRMAMGEMPAIFFLLAGYACFLAEKGRQGWMLRIMGMLFWGLALMTKTQVFPFFLLSMITPLFLAVRKRLWWLVKLISAGLFGSMAVLFALLAFQKFLLQDPSPPQMHIGLWIATTFVPLAFIRFWVLKLAMLLCLPLVLGLLYDAAKLKGAYRDGSFSEHAEFVRLSLLSFCSTWFAWYLLFSIGWLRYLFPATFIGSIFVAHLLYAVTSGFNLLKVLRDGISALLFTLNRTTITALFSILMIVWTLTLTGFGLYSSYASHSGTSISRVAHFVNFQTNPNKLIECSEVELFFLINRPYHHCFYDVGDLLTRKTFLHENISINYDALKWDPEYLIIGPTAQMHHLYDDLVQSTKFRLIYAMEPYEIYQRAR